MYSAVKRILLIALMAAAIPAAAAPKDMPVDAKIRRAAIEGVINRMHQHYVSPETAARVEARLRAQLQDGSYDQITSAREFARAVSKTLIETANDRHLRMRFFAEPLEFGFEPEDDPKAYKAEQAREALAESGGVAKFERMAGNIGYLKIDYFPPAAYVADLYAAAMTLLNGTDALIIDLRDNRGGEPAAVALLESYFFAQPTLMNKVFERRTGKTNEYWTRNDIKGPAYGVHKPVYILTSKFTFSGGEDLSYSMQAQKRATLVGETSGGGANPGEMRRVHPHFAAFVSDSRAINPITQTNWEGVGVVPHIATSREEALQRAYILAVQKLLETSTNPQQREGLASILATGR